jgi:hypothetical protein
MTQQLLRGRFVLAALLIGSLATAGCNIGFYGSSASYSDQVGPHLATTLLECSGVSSTWNTSSSGSSSHSGATGGWTSKSSWSGTFECDPTDLKALNQNLFDGMRLDIFGAGYQINIDQSVTWLMPFNNGGSPAVSFEIAFGDAANESTVKFMAYPKKSGEYSYVMDFAEASG